MSHPRNQFDDAQAYGRAAGPWSELVGAVFLDWLAPRSELRWIDVGCGNGAFSELLAQRCAPGEIQGIDCSEAQLDFARTRPGTKEATYLSGDALALPFGANRFDAAVMALVISLVPTLPPEGTEELRSRLRTRLPANAEDRIRNAATANAIRGQVPR